MLSRVVAIALVGSCLTLSAVSADDDPIKARQAMMKQVGGAMKTLAGMARQKVDYDAAKAAEAFATMNKVSQTYGTMFPEGSDQGDTGAAPAIWTDRATFDEKLASFQADTAAAVAAAPADLAAFGPVFGKVAGNCKSCHQDFKVDR